MDAVFLALIFCGYDHSLRHLTKEMWRTAMSLALTGAERSIGQRYNDLGQRLAQQLGDLVSDLQQRGEVRADIDPILIAKMLFNNFTAMYIACAKYLVMYLETLKTKVAGQMALISNLIENAPQMSKYNQPLSGNEMIRTGGPATFMRLPSQPTAQGLDACFIGIPMDIGTSNRPGARLGPRQIRDESRMLRPYNMATGAAPFANMQVADIGDVPINTFDLKKSVDIITDFYADILTHGTIPLTLGGDHTLTWPILRAIREKLGPVALVHVDAHADINDEMFGEKVAHGCPFRRAWEDGCLINEKVYQIGLRGTGYSPDDFDWGRQQGWTVIPAEECWYKSLAPLMSEIRRQIGDAPVYLSFDIDSLDPAYAPGTGTVEVGGLTSTQALEIIRGMAGLNVVGCDLVEVSPPYDPTGNTALIGANFLYEMLCALRQ